MEALKELGRSNLKELNPKAFNITTINLFELVILKYAAYYDEFHEHKFLISDSKIQRLIRTAFAKITKEWPDIDNYRNEIIAHSFRRGEESLFALALNTEYKVPVNIQGILILTETVKLSTDLLKNKYSEEFKIFESKIMMKSKQQKTPLN